MYGGCVSRIKYHWVFVMSDTPSINYTTIPRKDGKNCGNCAESDRGWCFYAGEIGSHYCDMWSERG